jgi:hypothetical protein
MVDPCSLCLKEEESTEHLLVQCVFAPQIWFWCLQQANLNVVAPTMESELESWLLETRRALDKQTRKRLDAWAMLITWCLWNQRNAKVF